MSENLMLTMDSELLEFANDFSRRTNKTISKIVEDYFAELKEKGRNDLPADFQELYGIYEGMDAPDKKELRRMVHDK